MWSPLAVGGVVGPQRWSGKEPGLPKLVSPNRLRPPWRQPRGKQIVSLVNSHTNVTSRRWHLQEIDVRFAPGLHLGWLQVGEGRTRPLVGPSPALDGGKLEEEEEEEKEECAETAGADEERPWGDTGRVPWGDTDRVLSTIFCSSSTSRAMCNMSRSGDAPACAEAGSPASSTRPTSLPPPHDPHKPPTRRPSPIRWPVGSIPVVACCIGI